jgi:DNA-binding MarR family transcriptional regulator
MEMEMEKTTASLMERTVRAVAGIQTELPADKLILFYLATQVTHAELTENNNTFAETAPILMREIARHTGFKEQHVGKRIRALEEQKFIRVYRNDRLSRLLGRAHTYLFFLDQLESIGQQLEEAYQEKSEAEKEERRKHQRREHKIRMEARRRVWDELPRQQLTRAEIADRAAGTSRDYVLGDRTERKRLIDSKVPEVRKEIKEGESYKRES